jgi:hypothetical protein
LNIYTQRFTVRCPNNETPVGYTLKIYSSHMIYVESIQEEVLKYTHGFHEEIADQLFAKFGGQQVITAHHHGTDITTTRP